MRNPPIPIPGYLGLALLLLVTLLTACGGEAGQFPPQASKSVSSDGDVPSSATASNASTPGGTTGSTPGKGETSGTDTTVSRSLPLTPARSFKYASLDFTVASGLITDGPASNSSNSSNPSKIGNLNLKLSINNPTKEAIRVEAGLFQLKLANNLVYQNPGNFGLKARETLPLEFNFEVPRGTNWDGALFSFGELDKEPVSVALVGPITQVPYPLAVTAGSEVSLETPQVNYKVTRASIDLDGPGQRAGKGKEFLTLSIVVTNLDKQNDAFVGESSFRLMLDGVLQPPDSFSPSGVALASFGKQEFLVSFQIAQSVKSANLEVGETDKSTATIPLDLKGVKPSSPQSPTATTGAVTPTTGTTTPSPVTAKAAQSSTASVIDRGGASRGKAPKSGEEVCGLVSKEEASKILGVSVDKAISGSATGYACDYYSGEKFLFQVYFEKVKVPQGYVNTTKLVYPDAKQILGVGDNNWWSSDSARFEIEQGDTYFAIVILTGETNREKLLDQATNIAKAFIGRLK